MTALNANVSADQEWLPLTDADSRSLADGFYTIDSENVKVENGPHPATSLSITPYNGRRAVRGVGGSTAASHLSGATLTRYYPEAPGGGASGLPDPIGAPDGQVPTIVEGAYGLAYPSVVFTEARSGQDGVTTDTDATFTAAGGNFTEADVGSYLNATGIPALTTIVSVTDGTTVELSANATASDTDVPYAVVQPEPAETVAGMVWVRALFTGGAFGQLVYQVIVRDPSDSFWDYPSLVDADEGGAVGAYVSQSLEGPDGGKFEFHAVGPDGIHNVVAINDSSAFIDAFYDYDAGTIASEVIVGGNAITIRHTNAAQDEVQSIVIDDTGIAVVTAGAATFTVNGLVVATVP